MGAFSAQSRSPPPQRGDQDLAGVSIFFCLISLALSTRSSACFSVPSALSVRTFGGGPGTRALPWASYHGRFQRPKQKPSPAARGSGLGGRLHFFLLNFLGLVDQIVGLFQRAFRTFSADVWGRAGYQGVALG